MSGASAVTFTTSLVPPASMVIGGSDTRSPPLTRYALRFDVRNPVIVTSTV